MSEPSTDRPAPFAGWLSLLGNRLLLSLLAVSLILLAITGLMMYRSAVDTVRRQSFNQLETVRTITAKSVDRYFASLEDQLRIMAEDRMVVDALRAFADGYRSILADDGADEPTVE
ncbi:MAG: hypothetical protein ACKOWG_18845, partial [Planctomycetia bacterium]